MNNVLKAVLVTSISVSAGCVAIPANNLKTIPKSQITFNSSAKTKVYSQWTFESLNSQPSESIKVASAAISKKGFEDAIKESNCCVIVDSRNEADVIVDGKAFGENNAAAMIPAFITGLSLYTIPSWVTAKIHLQTKVSAGSVTKEYDLTDSIKMYQWLPLIVVAPFKGNAINAAKEVDANTYRNIVNNMKVDGFLK